MSLLERGKTLVGSRTIWGAVILVANTIFAMNIPEELAAQVADAMNAAFMAIGASLVIIGRIGAKPPGQ